MRTFRDERRTTQMAVAIRPVLLAGERKLTLAPDSFVEEVRAVLDEQSHGDPLQGTYLYSISVVDRGPAASVDDPTYLYGRELYGTSASDLAHRLAVFTRPGTLLDVSIRLRGRGTEHTLVKIEDPVP
jgi:hypothetical protein